MSVEINFLNLFQGLLNNVYHSEKNYSLSDERTNKINSAVDKHLRGELSYENATKLAHEEGLFGQLRNNFTCDDKLNSKKDVITSKFRQVLMSKQLANSKANIDKLFDWRSYDYFSNNSSAYYYQQIISNVCFENSWCKCDISEVSYTNDELKITLRIHDKIQDPTGSRCEFKPVQFKTPKLHADIIEAECAIFKHKQSGGIYVIADKFKTHDSVKKYLSTKDKYKYDAICFSGGGAKGAGYAGILVGLGEQRLKRVEMVSGASAGALTSAFVACGIKPFEFEELIATNSLKLSQKQLTEFVKNQLFKLVKTRLAEFKKTAQIFSDAQENLIKKYSDATSVIDITFGELDELQTSFSSLGFKKLFLNASMINGKSPIEVELSNETCPTMPISLAATASAALPMLYDSVDIKKFILEPYAKKLGLGNEKTILVNDGGLISNIPYQYVVKKAKNPLMLAFYCDKSLYNKKLSFTEEIKNKIIGFHLYGFRRADVYALEHNHNIHYLVTDQVSLTSFESASKKFVVLINSIKNNFIQHEIEYAEYANSNKTVNLQLTDEKQQCLKKLKFDIYPLYYGGTDIEKSILREKNSTGSSYFEQLKNETDYNKLDELFKEVKRKILQQERVMAFAKVGRYARV